MGLNLVTAPAEAAVPLALVKAHVRVTNSNSDTLLSLYLSGATDRVERFLGRSLIDQTWDYVLDAFPSPDANGAAGFIEIPRPPLIELEGVFYLDGDGVEQEMDAADYVVDASRHPARVTSVDGTWPTPADQAAAVRLRFRSGYLDQGVSPAESNVPDAIQVAILLLVGDLYAHRETLVVGDTTAELPDVLQSYLRPYRVRLGMA